MMRSGVGNLDICQRSLLYFSASEVHDLVLRRPPCRQTGLAFTEFTIHQYLDPVSNPTTVLLQ